MLAEYEPKNMSPQIKKKKKKKKKCIIVPDVLVFEEQKLLIRFSWYLTVVQLCLQILPPPWEESASLVCFSPSC